jgi:hypothetical protein
MLPPFAVPPLHKSLQPAVPPIYFQIQGTMSNTTEESPPPSIYHDASPLTMHLNPDLSLYSEVILDGIINDVDPDHHVNGSSPVAPLRFTYRRRQPPPSPGKAASYFPPWPSNSRLCKASAVAYSTTTCTSSLSSHQHVHESPALELQPAPSLWFPHAKVRSITPPKHWPACGTSSGGTHVDHEAWHQRCTRLLSPSCATHTVLESTLDTAMGKSQAATNTAFSWLIWKLTTLRRHNHQRPLTVLCSHRWLPQETPV